MCPLHSMLNSFIHMKSMQLLYTKSPMQLAVISSKPGEEKLFLGGENLSASPPPLSLYETLYIDLAAIRLL